MRLPLVALFCLLFSATASGETDTPSDNPYASNYVSRMPAPAAQGEAGPRIFRGTDKDADYLRLLEQGYDLLGYSSFEAGDVAPERLVEQASALHADLALVYTQRIGRVPASVKLDQAKAAARPLKGGAAPPATVSGEQPKFYEYYAAYWTKLPAPLLGVHVRRDGKLAKDARGLEVIAVIGDSPAAMAGLRRGDTLLQLGDVDLREPEALVEAARRYAGQRVAAVLDRDGSAVTAMVQLNARR